MDRRTYAAKASDLLSRATFSRDQLAREAGISFRSLKVALAPSTAENVAALPVYLEALADRLEAHSRELPQIIAELRALAKEGAE